MSSVVVTNINEKTMMMILWYWQWLLSCTLYLLLQRLRFLVFECLVVVLDRSPSNDDGLLSLSALLEATGATDDDDDDGSGNDNNWESFLFWREGEESPVNNRFFIDLFLDWFYFIELPEK